MENINKEEFIKSLKFDEKGLIPAIIVDSESKKVLTLAYMNKESLGISLDKGLPAFGAVRARNSGSKAKPAAIISISWISVRTATATRFWSR